MQLGDVNLSTVSLQPCGLVHLTETRWPAADLSMSAAARR